MPSTSGCGRTGQGCSILPKSGKLITTHIGTDMPDVTTQMTTAPKEGTEMFWRWYSDMVAYMQQEEVLFS
jgi:hypothetical protein